MRTPQKIKDRKCPICGRIENQINAGKNRSGTQRCYCNVCRKYYTYNSKAREYSEDIRQQAIDALKSGKSGRQVGKEYGMSKANVYNWIKKSNK